MNTNNHYIGYHLQTIYHHNSEEALIFKDFRIYFYFVTFNWEFFPVEWENNMLFSIGNMTEYQL
jgi:hypothetical protein